jgi:hypothetical protein
LKKVSTLGKFLQSFLELFKDEKELHTLWSMIYHYGQRKVVPTENKVVNQLLCNKITNREFRFNA